MLGLARAVMHSTRSVENRRYRDRVRHGDNRFGNRPFRFVFACFRTEVRHEVLVWQRVRDETVARAQQSVPQGTQVDRLGARHVARCRQCPDLLDNLADACLRGCQGAALPHGVEAIADTGDLSFRKPRLRHSSAVILCQAPVHAPARGDPIAPAHCLFRGHLGRRIEVGFLARRLQYDRASPRGRGGPS